jgi:alpha-L-fucosidase
MKNRLYIRIIALLLLATIAFQSTKSAQLKAETPEQKTKRMAWWTDAHFGMFIHWGLYAVPAGKWGESTWNDAWLMQNAKISRAEYSKLAEKFNPTQFNAEDWVKLAKDAGQKYIVLTAKHHDGFAMFKSSDPYNVVDATPFKRDVVKEYAVACRKYGMKMGLYYSQAQDWYHPGGAVWGNKEWDSTHIASMDKYIDEVALPQVKEILGNYGDVAVLWWDTPVGMTKEMGQKLDAVVKQYPNLITNNRLGGGFGGDLETPEQFIPATGFPGRNWEVCMTLNGNWGYNAYDENWKGTKDVVQMLVDIVSKGGNFLLNVGPDKMGVVPMVCQNTLRETGEWLKTNGEAIYGAQASPFPYLYWGRATRKGQKLYLYVFNWPKDGKLIVPLGNIITTAGLLGAPKSKLTVRQVKDQNIITLPEYAPDRNASVIAIDFVGEPQVLAAPSIGKNVLVSSSDNNSKPENLTDNKLATIWQAAKDQKNATLEIDLGTTFSISAVGLIEKGVADGVLQHRKQLYEMQYWNGTEWKIAVKGSTNGSGIVQSYEKVKAQKFRLLLEAEKGETALAEWVLYRAE